MPMGVLAPGSEHDRHSAQPHIDLIGFFWHKFQQSNLQTAPSTLKAESPEEREKEIEREKMPSIMAKSLALY